MKPQDLDFDSQYSATRMLRSAERRLDAAQRELDALSLSVFRVAELNVSAAMSSVAAALALIDDDLPHFPDHIGSHVRFVIAIRDDDGDVCPWDVEGTIAEASYDEDAEDDDAPREVVLRDAKIHTDEWISDSRLNDPDYDPADDEAIAALPPIVDGVVALDLDDIWDVRELRAPQQAEPGPGGPADVTPLYPEDVVGED